MSLVTTRMVTQSKVLHVCIVLFCVIGDVFGVQKDVVFVVDKSGSVSQSDFDTAIDFIKDVVSFLTIGTGDVQVSVVTFSSTNSEEFDLDDNTAKANLLTAIEGLKSSIATGGGTYTADALNYVESTSFTAGKGARVSADPVVVVMTDGFSNNGVQTKTAADLIRSSVTGSIIYAIGIGSNANTQELSDIASDPDSDNVMTVTSFVYICNLVPPLVLKIDSSVAVSIAANCPTTQAPTSVSPTPTSVSPTSAAKSSINTPAVIGVAVAGGAAIIFLGGVVGCIIKMKLANRVADISSSNAGCCPL